jgi:hypothetical protein
MIVRYTSGNTETYVDGAETVEISEYSDREVERISHDDFTFLGGNPVFRFSPDGDRIRFDKLDVLNYMGQSIKKYRRK